MISGIFVTAILTNAVMAWGGSQFAVITLAVVACFLALFLGFYGAMLGSTLQNWGLSLERWQAAQEWGVKKDKIMDDILAELGEHDEEAAFIHAGRSREADLEYMEVLHE